jgi:hypothetical protein
VERHCRSAALEPAEGVKPLCGVVVMRTAILSSVSEALAVAIPTGLFAAALAGVLALLL